MVLISYQKSKHWIELWNYSFFCQRMAGGQCCSPPFAPRLGAMHCKVFLKTFFPCYTSKAVCGHIHPTESSGGLRRWKILGICTSQLPDSNVIPVLPKGHLIQRDCFVFPVLWYDTFRNPCIFFQPGPEIPAVAKIVIASVHREDGQSTVMGNRRDTPVLAQRNERIASGRKILRLFKTLLLTPLSIFVISHSPGGAVQLSDLVNTVFFGAILNLLPGKSSPMMPALSHGQANFQEVSHIRWEHKAISLGGLHLPRPSKTRLKSQNNILFEGVPRSLLTKASWPPLAPNKNQ